MIYTKRFALTTVVELREEVDDVITNRTHRDYTGKRTPSAWMRAAGIDLGLSSEPTVRYIKF